MVPLAAIDDRTIVLFIHVFAVVVTFGVVFIYPLANAIFRRADNERYLPMWHRLQGEIGQKIIAPGGVVILLAGLYLVFVADTYEFGEPWIGSSLLILIVIEGIGGAYFGPTEKRLVELAERDLAAGALSAEYREKASTLAKVQYLAMTLVVVAVFLMVTKPG